MDECKSMQRPHRKSCTCLCYIMSETVESLCVSVPLDPAEVLYYSLYCSGQTLGIRHHLVHTNIHIHIVNTLNS